MVFLQMAFLFFYLTQLFFIFESEIKKLIMKKIYPTKQNATTDKRISSGYIFCKIGKR